MRLSVILCTHNPRPEYLRRTLEGLRGQTLPVSEWELLLVDNASAAPLAPAWDLSWQPRGRHAREAELGLTPARLCGIRESRGALVLFVDDDNVLDPGYLETTLTLMDRHPYLGAIGAGNLEPEFEVPPARELEPLLPLLALRSVGAARWGNNPADSGGMPFGAGLCVRRVLADGYVHLVQEMNIRQLLDRKGGQLCSHGDDLFSWAAARMELGFGVFPELRARHLISAGRLNRAYFRRLIRDSAFSHWLLRYLLASATPAGLGPVRLLRVALHGLRNGLFSMQCQWAHLVGEARARRCIADHGLPRVSSQGVRSRS